MTSAPRDETGRFAPIDCPDQNCDGELSYAPEDCGGYRTEHWHCNGLTHRTDDGPLVACERTVTGRSFKLQERPAR